jgi:hypothetical protein
MMHDAGVRIVIYQQTLHKPTIVPGNPITSSQPTPPHSRLVAHRYLLVPFLNLIQFVALRGTNTPTVSGKR